MNRIECTLAGLCSAKWSSFAGNSAAALLWIIEEAEMRLSE